MLGVTAPGGLCGKHYGPCPTSVHVPYATEKAR